MSVVGAERPRLVLNCTSAVGSKAAMPAKRPDRRFWPKPVIRAVLWCTTATIRCG